MYKYLIKLKKNEISISRTKYQGCFMQFIYLTNICINSVFLTLFAGYNADKNQTIHSEIPMMVRYLHHYNVGKVARVAAEISAKTDIRNQIYLVQPPNERLYIP